MNVESGKEREGKRERKFLVRREANQFTHVGRPPELKLDLSFKNRIPREVYNLSS